MALTGCLPTAVSPESMDPCELRLARGDLERVGTNDLGYPIYESIREPAFVLTNASKGNESESVAVSAFKSWDNGFDLRLGYAWTSAQDVNPMTSSISSA